MLTFRHQDVLDYGIDRIKTACNSIALINYAYARGDAYATVRGAANINIIAEATGLTSADFTVANQGTLGRKVSNAVKTATCVKQSNGTSTQLGFAFLDTVNSKVLAICDEGTDKIIYVGDTVTFPITDINANQPT